VGVRAVFGFRVQGSGLRVEGFETGFKGCGLGRRQTPLSASEYHYGLAAPYSKSTRRDAQPSRLRESLEEPPSFAAVGNPIAA
jgi:hypothetical protein